jgi:hypothetical protein
MIYDGDIDRAKELVNVAKKVINKGSSVRYEPFEKRVQLWNDIKQNQDIYESGECGKILDVIDKDYRATYDFALLILARSFNETADEFPASQVFSEEELKIYEKIEKYNVFEISTKEDIKKRVIAKDKNLLGLFEEYYVKMDKWVEETIDNSDMRLTLRYYLKKKWREHKQKMNDAVNDLIRDFDWFRVLVTEWGKRIEEATTKEDEKSEDETIEEEEEIEEIIEDGPRFIEIGEAKFYEHNFIGRTKNKLHGKLEFSGKKFKIEDLQEHAGADLSNYIHDVSENTIKNIPENKYVIVRLIPKKLFRKKPIILKAVFCSRVGKYAKSGFDTYPLELNDINPYISDAMNETKDERMLLCIASPTGFSNEVQDHIGGREFHQNFLGTVSICLIDLVTGKLITNPHDKIAKEFMEIFALEIDEEKVAKAKKQVTETMIEKGGVRLDDFIKRHGYKKQIVEKAFYDLKEEKDYKVEYRRDLGTQWLWKE